MITTIITTVFTEVIFNEKNIIALTLILFTTYFFITNKKYYIYSFVLLCLMGILNFIDAFYLNFLFIVFIFKINPIYFIILVAFLLTNKELIKEKIK